MTRPPADTGVGARAEVERQPLGHWLAGETWPAILADLARRHWDARAYRWLEGPDAAPVDLSFRTLHEQAGLAAHAFAGLGDKPVIASLLPGLPATLPLAFGAMQAGIYMPINPMLDPDAIAAMLAEARAQVLLLPEDMPEPTPIRAATPGLTVLRIGTASLSAGDLAPLGSGQAPPDPGPEAICAYFHTGGTTGAPKIAMLRQRNLAFMAWLAGFGGGMEAGDVVPCGMPLFHVGGLIFGGLAPLAAGASIVQLGAGGFRDPAMRQAFPAIANREGATILFAPPTIAVDVLDSTEPHPFTTARHWVSSAAPLPAATHNAFTAHTGLAVKEAWGLTEASLVLTFAPSGAESRPGSVGPALPYCRLAVVDPGTRVPVGVGESGLILARSPGLFAGYLGAEPSGLAPGPDGEDWLDTGDLGLLDADGWLTITGRAKDIILRAGHNIDPATIEAAYLAEAGVAAAIAVGKPDARVGERPVLFLTATAGAELEPEALRQRANARIADPVARPREVHVLPTLPVTAIGKPDRPALRCRAAQLAVEEVARDAETVEALPGPGGTTLIRLVPESARDAAAVRTLGLELLAATSEASLS
ncbi:MAG: AMP-binding protein [Pseudomonadota bacterium]